MERKELKIRGKETKRREIWRKKKRLKRVYK